VRGFSAQGLSSEGDRRVTSVRRAGLRHQLQSEGANVPYFFSKMHISSAQQLRGRSGRTGPLLQLQRLLSQCVALWAATVRTNREHTSLAVQHYRDCSASAEYCLVVRARRCRSTAQRRLASLFEPFVFSHFHFPRICP